MRTKEALALRKAEGVVLGRRKGSYTKLNVLVENRHSIVRMLNQDKTITDICRLYDLSRDTFDKFRRSHPLVQQAVDEKKRRRMKR